MSLGPSSGPKRHQTSGSLSRLDRRVKNLSRHVEGTASGITYTIGFIDPFATAGIALREQGSCALHAHKKSNTDHVATGTGVLDVPVQIVFLGEHRYGDFPALTGNQCMSHRRLTRVQLQDPRALKQRPFAGEVAVWHRVAAAAGREAHSEL